MGVKRKKLKRKEYKQEKVDIRKEVRNNKCLGTPLDQKMEKIASSLQLNVLLRELGLWVKLKKSLISAFPTTYHYSLGTLQGVMMGRIIEEVFRLEGWRIHAFYPSRQGEIPKVEIPGREEFRDRLELLEEFIRQSDSDMLARFGMQAFPNSRAAVRLRKLKDLLSKLQELEAESAAKLS